MIDLLRSILCAIVGLAVKAADLAVAIVNGVIYALSAAAQAAVNLLPLLPDAPAKPTGGILATVNWFLPVGGLLAGLVVFVGLWGIFMAVRIPLRWVKAL